MSYENSGIPLVVRYNNRGEPDGLKEELNIRVTSINADVYRGGNLGISALSAVQDLNLSSPIQDGDVITWSSIDGSGTWTNTQPGGGGTGPGVNTFIALTDTPGTYTPGGSVPGDAVLIIGGGGLTFADRGASDLDNYNTLYTSLASIAQGRILTKSSANPYTFDSIPNNIFNIGAVDIDQGQANGGRILILGDNGDTVEASTRTNADLAAALADIQQLETDIANLTLNDLDGVTITNAQSSQVLTYVGNEWINQTPSTGTGVTTFRLLTDTPDGPYTSHPGKLVYVNASINELDYSDYTITTIQNLETLRTTTIPGIEEDITDLTTASSTISNRITNLVLDDLFDVDLTTPATDGQYLVYVTSVGGSNTWQAQDLPTIVGTFEGLSDTPDYAAGAADAGKILVVDPSDGQGIVFSTYTTTSLEQIATNTASIAANADDISDALTTANTTSSLVFGMSLGRVLKRTSGNSNDLTGITSVDFTLQNLNDTTNAAPNNAYTDQFLKWDPTANGGLGQWRITRVAGFYTTGSAGDIQEGRVNASGLGGDGLEEGFLKITPITSSVTTINKISVSGDLNASGFEEGYSLVVGPSGTVTAISTAPLEGQEGKITLINQSSTAEVNSSAIIWDYPTETLNIAGDVSAYNFYGTFSGASGIVTNLSGVSSIQFATDMPAEYTAVEGEVYYDTDAHTLSIQTGPNTTLQVGQEQVIRVRNDSGEQLVDGTVVYVSGTQGTGVAKLLIGKADASVSEEEQDIIGIVTETIDNNSDGFITTFGLVRNVNTSGFPEGTLLYLGETPGTFTDTAPNSGFHAIRLGVVLREHQTDGVIFAKIDPGYDLQNLHDVDISGIQSGDILRWNGTELIPSGFDHGLMTGLSDDDHSQYVFKSPTGSARNTIQPGSDVPALTLQEGLSQTEPLLVVKDALTTTTLTVDGDGNIDTTGKLTAQSKSFLIDHPTKEGMKLQYTCLEGPENGVYCRGRVKTNVIILPDYWVGLVDEDTITVNLTPAGKKQPNLFVEDIRDNKIFLSSSESIDCFYTVFGERKDIDKLIVEF